jgi:peroxin-1
MAPDDFLVQLRTNASIFLRSAGDARKRRKAPGNSSSMPHANGTISSTTITTMTTTTSSPPPPPHAFTSLYRDEQLAVRLSDLKGHDAAAETALTQLSVMLNRKLIAARQRLSTPAPGCLLLCSSAGCGRTMLAMGMASFLSRQVDTLANTVWISCKDLVGDKISTIKKTLSTALRLARRRAPSVLVLDDLDALVPHEDQSDGGVNVRTAQLAEFVADLFSDHSFELSCAAATQMRVDHVGIVATASSPTSLHVGLRATGLFTFRVDLKAPNAAARQGILGKLLSLHEGRLRSQAGCAMGLHTELDLNDQAAATEGYTCHDLRQVVERVVHASTIRCLKRQQAEQATRPGDGQLSVMVGVEDFETALDGFVPSSLKDLKLATSSVSWADIGGLDEARSTLKDTLELPSRYQRLFAQVPLKLRSGLLLYGPPGCGKTLLASAVAQECGLNFISVKGPELLNKYIGQSEQAVRDAFGRAAAAAPSILFFDEFEAIAPKRGGDSTGVTDRVVNQLLTFLDGVESRTGVYVLGASSRPDLIDPALLRPGRLDKCVYCGVPDVGERESILRACSRKLEMDPDVDLAAIARQADYYTGADLQAIVSSVQLEMVHESLDAALKGKKEGAKLTAAGLPSASQRHFDKAFQGSSLSLSAKERAKFTKIYSKFINARSDRSDQEFDPKGNMKTAMA